MGSDVLVMIARVAEAMAEPLKWVVIVGGVYLWGRVWRRPRAPQLENPDGVNENLELLRNSVEDLRTEVGEMQERLDFAERLLTRGAEVPDDGH